MNFLDQTEEELNRLSSGVKSADKVMQKGNGNSLKQHSRMKVKASSNKYTDIMSIEVTNYSLFDDKDDDL